MNAFDLSILSFLNRFAHRSLSFDQAVVFLSDANLLKGGVIVGMIWWIWFDRENVQRKREALLARLDGLLSSSSHRQDSGQADVSGQALE